MRFQTSESLTTQQINSGLQQVTRDGLATEAMSCLTEGAFLVALALQLGASNFQIGLLAALPTFTNVFQLAAIWLVQRFQSRKLITVLSIFVARVPLFIVGILPFFLPKETALKALTSLMFVHYFFGSIAGSSWNSWIKDLVPQNRLGSYFSTRTRLTQTLNVTLSLSLGFFMSYIKTHSESFGTGVFPLLFIIGGVAGMISVYVLMKAPEPHVYQVKDNLWKLFLNTIKDRNFKKLLIFNSFWVFAFNLAAPFFSVYMMKTMGLPVSYIIFLNVLSQVSSILFVRVWGRYSDKYSNKNIIRICAPLYITGLFAWSLVASSSPGIITGLLLVAIHILVGVSTAGINLSLTNIWLKLAPNKDAMMYMAAKNTITALFSAAGPLTGAMLADFFATPQIEWSIEWKGMHLLALHQWNFFFLTAAFLTILSLRLLTFVKEDGEVLRAVVVNNMRYNFRDARAKAMNSSVAHFRAMPANIKKRFYNIREVMRYSFAERKRA